MEAPPPPPPPPQISAAPTVLSAGGPAYPESIDSSPRSRHTDSWEADPPPPQKLRLMCSYGGHIVPRPHDKTLCYIGGDTRIIVIDRQTSLADLHHRLSKTLLHNEPFSLKYQLPREDLDSLISVTTEEDLENMVEECDRLSAAGGDLNPGRLRLFLFPKQSSNIEQILVETASTKSDDWFFNALNGKTSNLSAASDRGFSESSSVNCLLGLDDESVGKASAAAAGKDADLQNEGSKNGNSNTVTNHDVHSVPDSPMLETTSSFGSTSSTPSVANLPPIRVKVDDNPKVGIEEQFQQINVGVTRNISVAPPQQKPEEIGGFVHAGVEAAALVPGVPVVVGSEYAAANRVISDDERSDHGGYRKVQQIQAHGQVQLQAQQIPQLQLKQTGPFDLASPDSVSSEGSVRQRHAMYQESIVQMQSGNPRVSTDPKTGDQNNTRIQMQPQIQESGHVLTGQYDQTHPQLHHKQQFVHTGNHYIPANAMPMASYYPIYSHQQQQHHPHQPMLEQQYPIYFMPARQTQAYNMAVQQPGYSELAPTAPSSRPQTPPTGLTSHGGYTQVINAPSSKAEMASGGYRTSAGAAPQIVQIPSSQHQGQYVGFTQIHHPSQSVAPSSAPNQAYDFADPAHAQMFYTQSVPPQLAALPAQYQTMTSGPAAMLPDGSSAQHPADNLKQQVRTLPQ